MKDLLFLALLFLSSFAQAQGARSAFRRQGESWRLRANNYRKELSNASSVYERRVLWDEIDFKIVPEWESIDSVERAFQSVRDTRYLDDPSVPNFLRRLSWLYPDDGCFMRAAFMSQMIEKVFSKETARIFVFGNLSVETNNSPEGRVNWWYHTAPIVKQAEKILVFDPAINPSSLTEIKIWIQKQSNSLDEVELSVCDANAYSPGENCEGSQSDEETALLDAPVYLPLERDRQIELQRNPDEVLGENPPWLELR